jgi:hypothetical protein
MTPVAPKIVATTPFLTEKKATITIDTPVSNPNTKIIKVEAVLPSETRSAVASVADNNIVLEPVATSTASFMATAAGPSETMWTGQKAVTSAPADAASIVPPTITATDKAGNIEQVMVEPGSIMPQKTSLVDQYLLFKMHPDQSLGKIFNLGAIYFKILLALAIFILSLNIFINIKKQHHKPILSGLGLIVFLVMLIVF